MTSSLLEKLPKDIVNLLRLIGAYADLKGVTCYLVGGVVRDLLLGKPTLDLDIVVETDAIEFSKVLSQKYQTAITIYPRFKTTTLVWPRQISVDFASARKESYPAPGALPAVSLGSIKDDLLRRDFTINAMAISLNQKGYGSLLDESEGLKDLEAKKIRIFHPQSFRDDPTRILRAVRFEQRYHFQLETETEKCLEEALRDRCDRLVSPGRYFEEFKKILKESKPLRYLQRLEDLKGLDFFDEAFKLSRETEKHFTDLDEALTWLETSCSKKEEFVQWLIYFMILLDGYSTDAMKDILNRFSFSRHDCNKMISSKLEYEVVKRLDMHILKPSQIYKVLQSVSLEELVFFLIKTKGSPPELCIKKFLTDYRHIRLFLKGDDLMKLGVKDGKKMGEILRKLLEKKIDSGVVTKEKELQILDQIEKEAS
jgi:tRNA nucleotidyltransferase (CCA-adding enzyme)